MAPSGPSGRVVSAVSTDVDRLLGPKTLEQLQTLERQISQKLQSNEPIDVEYWEQLLRNIAVYKAKAELKNFYQSVIDSRLQVLRGQQIEEAALVKEKLSLLLGSSASETNTNFVGEHTEDLAEAPMRSIPYSKVLEPDPLLKIKVEDKGLDVVGEADFVNKIV